MQTKCELLDQCRFINRVTINLKNINQRWINLYCGDYERSELCERKKIIKKTGESAADNMAPTGIIV
jgi:hypothetical protein